MLTSQFHLSDVMDLAKIVYWELDPDTETFTFNDSFYAFYGTTAEREGGLAHVGRRVWEEVHTPG